MFGQREFIAIIEPKSFFGNVITGLVAQLFEHELNKQRLEIAKVQQEEYFANFKKTILNAGQEVSNTLYKYQVPTDEIKICELQLNLFQKSVDFTKNLLKYKANTNYTNVLTSEQRLRVARLSSVNNKVQ